MALATVTFKNSTFATSTSGVRAPDPPATRERLVPLLRASVSSPGKRGRRDDLVKSEGGTT